MGDSITANGAYVSFLEYAMFKGSRNKSTDVIAIGLGSETANGLSEKTHPFPRPTIHNRIDRVLEIIQPEVVFVCYGMNDGIYHPQTPSILEAYKTGLRSLVTKIEASGANAIVLTPPPFDPIGKGPSKLAPDSASDWSFRAPHKDYHLAIEAFSQWIMKEAPGRHRIDLNQAMTQAIQERRQKTSTFTYARDGIHPNEEGHLLMANTIARDWPSIQQLGTLGEIKADPVFKLIDARRKLRSKAWLHHVGYTRGKTVPPQPLGDAEEQAVELLEAARKAIKP